MNIVTRAFDFLLVLGTFSMVESIGYSGGARGASPPIIQSLQISGRLQSFTSINTYVHTKNNKTQSEKH